MDNKLINGLKGVHIASGIPVEIPLNSKEMQLAMDNGPLQNDSWEMLNASVVSFSTRHRLQSMIPWSIL